MSDKTFAECKLDAKGTIYSDWEDGEFRCLIMRGPCSLCAYIGVKPGHPLFGKDYAAADMPDVDCHGGLTFSGDGEGGPWPVGYWWFGWDYAHYQDAAFFDNWIGGETEWTPEMVRAEFPAAIASFRQVQL